MPMHVLVLCTGNSARSIVAEKLIEKKGAGVLTAASAGSRPTGKVNPTAIAMLADKGYDTSQLASKTMDVHLDGPPIDIVITVCDSAKDDPCAVWPGAPITVHWSLPDPAYIEPDQARRDAFEKVYTALEPAVDCLLRAVKEGLKSDTLRAALVAAAPELKEF